MNNLDSKTFHERALLLTRSDCLLSGPDIVQDTPMSNITEVEEDRNMKRKIVIKHNEERVNTSIEMINSCVLPQILVLS